MLDILSHELQTGHRAGRMMEALIASDHKGAKVVLTTRLTDPAGKEYHQTFAIRKWMAKGGQAMLTVEVSRSGDWAAGIKPISVMHANLATLVMHASKDSRATDPLLRYAAEAAVAFAWLGEAGLPTPKNGSVEVKEEDTCGRCGRSLTDPTSIDRGIGPECFGRTTGTTTILSKTAG